MFVGAQSEYGLNLTLTAILFVLAFAVGCLLALGRHPIYGLLTYVGNLYLHPPSRWWAAAWMHDVRWAFIAAGITLVAVMLRNHRAPNIPLFHHKFMWGMVIFCIWIIVQLLWVVEPSRQADLIEYYIKFAIVIGLIYYSIDSERHFAWFMWAHVLGCFYFGWIAYTSYGGGRFEAFGGPGLGEANAAALTMATGVFFAAGLFLSGSVKVKAALVGLIAIIVNGIVTTISRSGFLAMAIGGLFFNLFTPARYAGKVRILSVLALVLFVMLTNPTYWLRIQSIKYKGEQVQGVDTGGGRLEVMQAQIKMFEANPLGCGNACTEFLSPSYIDQTFLNVETGRRASHNTFMSFTVDQGIIGSVLYVLMLAWVFSALRKLLRHYRNSASSQAMVLPAIAAAIGAMTLGDMFVPYVLYEVRYWFIALVMVMLNLASRDSEPSLQER